MKKLNKRTRDAENYYIMWKVEIIFKNSFIKNRLIFNLKYKVTFQMIKTKWYNICCHVSILIP